MTNLEESGELGVEKLGGTRTAKMSTGEDILRSGIKFDFSQEINITELRNVIDSKSEEDHVEIALVIKQSKDIVAVQAHDLKDNCR